MASNLGASLGQKFDKPGKKMAVEGMCREGAAHFKSQSDANAVLYHIFSAVDADAAAFSSAGTNAQKRHSGISAVVRTPTNIHSHASYPKITFIVSCQIYGEAT